MPLADGAPIFYVVEIDIFAPGTAILRSTLGWATTAWGTLSLKPDPVQAVSKLLASDVGYRSLAADSIGVVPYPPYLAEAFQVDRGVVLPPGDATTTGAWGQITLANDNGQYDALVGAANGDHREIKILRGQKLLDPGRGIFLDPSYDSLEPVFVGLGMPWFLAETTLSVPLSDTQYWLSLPVQIDTYLGTGGYEGDAAIASQLKPKTRGAAFNVTPKLVDTVNRIYQYTDQAGTIAHLYEGGAEVFTFDSDTTDLTTGFTPPGSYRTDNSRGCFQLGSVPDPNFSITCDVTGAFAAAGVKTVLADIAYSLLIEDLGIPVRYMDADSFAAAAANFPFEGGAYYASDSGTTGMQALAYLLTSFGAKPVSNREGKLQCLSLLALTGSEVSTFSLNITDIVTITPQPLDATISPPPYRVRVACKHNYTVQTSGLNTATATPAQLQYVAVSDQYGADVDDTVLLNYARPNDLAPFGGALSSDTDAASVATNTLATFGESCRLYEVEVPTQVGLLMDLGDIGAITYPIHDLRNGKLCQVVHESFKSDDPSITFLVLVTGAAASAATGLYDNNGVLGVVDTAGWPATSAGAAGSVWSNGGAASVVPGGTLVPGAPVFFGSITAAQLLALGGLGLSTTSPTPGSLQLWLLNDEILIA